VACFSGVEHCPWSPPFRQSLLQMLVVLGSILSVLCVPSILVQHKDPLFRTSRVPLRRSRLYDPCNTLLLYKDPLFRTSRVPLRRSRLYDPCNTLLHTSAAQTFGFRCDVVACMTHVTPFFFCPNFCPEL
jgi:hypothetical protein